MQLTKKTKIFFFSDPSTVMMVEFDPVTNTSVTASFEQVEGILDNYIIRIIDPDDFSLVIYTDITPTGTFNVALLCVIMALRQT